jgi:hypothetical protein
MNIFTVIDHWLFGTPVEYATTSRYTLEDSVSRLASVVIPRFKIFKGFRQSLVGYVDQERVRVSWYSPWRSTCRSWFEGHFMQDKSGVRLVGSIGVPTTTRILLYGSIFAALVYLCIILTFITPSADQSGFRYLPIAIIPVAFILATRIDRWMYRDSVQRIADALDAALS